MPRQVEITCNNGIIGLARKKHLMNACTSNPQYRRQHAFFNTLAVWRLIANAAFLSATECPPNFVLISSDDQVFGGLQCFGSPQVHTPNLVKLARKIAKLTS